MPPAASNPLALRLRKRKRSISLKMYALLTLAIICFCLCSVQYSMLSGTHAAHIEAPHHAELAARVGEIASKRRNESQIWDDHQDTSARLRYRNMSTVDPLSFSEDLYLETSSLTALLPVTSTSLPLLERQLHTLMNRSDYLTEIVLVPQEALQSECRRALLSFLSVQPSVRHVEISFAPWPVGADKISAMLRAARHVATPLLLILDEDGLENIDERGRDALTLLSPFSTAVPLGPRGLTSAAAEPACLSASEIPQPVDYLVPPFILPAFLLQSELDARSNAAETWRSLGKTISGGRTDLVGGFMVGSDVPGSHWCTLQATSTANGSEAIPLPLVSAAVESSPKASQDALRDTCPVDFGSVALLLSSVEELRHLSSAACPLQRNGHALQITVLDDTVPLPPGAINHNYTSLQLRECSLSYLALSQDIVLQAAVSSSPWIYGNASISVVITSWAKQSLLGAALIASSDSRDATVIHIPQDDLPYCDWIGTLTFDELRNWHKPQVTVSVITHDRPDSLSRLLDSLTRARYFGDLLDLRLNVEQTSDWKTQQIVSDYTWEHGSVFLHRRIIHGGLLPAVVESWYPQSNNSYGLILEDDVELSPLFYAWVKLSLLQYRYGRTGNVSPQLFGISLYQQKHLELRLEGRHPFNARSTFASIGSDDPSAPYLSQIPCSWGAVYFPEHWREFHAYLSFRLSEYAWDADQVVVPGVRSNKWMRSWKKYFIELAYLRGYVMLYPNYADYVSLSTNHLEVGAHVKDVPIETYLRKKRLFLLPLMPLPEPFHSEATGLLELPRGQLPEWSDLPTLDLLGLVASEEILRERGRVRRTELTDCLDPPVTPYDVWDLLCLRDPLLGLR